VAVLRDHPDAAIVGAAGEVDVTRRAGLAAHRLQLDHQRGPHADPIQRADQWIDHAAADLALELELA
jgi:hypothetical protein